MPDCPGIGSYAAYLPSYVLHDARLDATGPVRPGGPGRSVAAFDEDVVTMAVEALRSLDLPTRGHLLLATTSAPYDVKTAAGIVHEALGLDPAVPAVDLRGHRSGVSALDLVLSAGAGAVLADVRTTRSGAPDELAHGDAAAAFLPGTDAAELLARTGRTIELLERWRLPGERHDRVWDERFTAHVLAEAALEVAAQALAEAGLESVDHVVVSSSNARASAAVRRALRGAGLDLAVERRVGFTGAAHPGLLLAAALDVAEPGQSVLLVSATEGADAFVLRVGERVRAARRGPSVEQQLAGREELGYGRFLRWRGLLEVQGPARPAAPAPAAPPMRRRTGWKFRLEASVCGSCQAVTTPPSRVCAACATPAPAGDTATVSLRDRVATVVSVTSDHLTTMPEGQVSIVVADVDGGGRLTAYAADVRPGQVEVGARMRPVFRRLWTTDAIHNYFWKLRPWEDNR